MIRFIYIGHQQLQISHFKEIVGSSLFITDSLKEAIKSCTNLSKRVIVIILYEKINFHEDFSRISSLKKKINNSYIILITDALSEEERKEYLKSGVNNTIKPDIEKDVLLENFEFITKRYHQLSPKHKPEIQLNEFRLPLWKRIFDLLFSLLAILLLSPFFLIVALAIRIESKGPIIYKSKRVGSNYKVFDFLKFRSMYTDADKHLKDFKTLNQYQDNNDVDLTTEISRPISESLFDLDNDGVMLISDDFIIPEEDYITQRSTEQKNTFVKLENDPRITKIGRFIRKYSIDELPQLFNILKGDMSIVGNRPLPLYEAELLTSDEYIDRFMAPAGLTGLWQVEKRGDSGKLSPEERKQLDIQYAKTFSFWLDIKIILKTVTAFVQKENV